MTTQTAARNDNELDAHMLSTLRSLATVSSYPPGTPLTLQGQTERTFYVLESGWAVVVRQMEDGEEHTLALLGPRQSFGEMAILDDSPRMATVKTLTDATVL